MTQQSKDYARGYAAGKRREDLDERERARNHTIMLARYRLLAAIAPEVLRSPWVKADGSKINTADGMAGTIVGMLHAIEGKM